MGGRTWEEFFGIPHNHNLLTNQQYTNTSKIYYHGSVYDFVTPVIDNEEGMFWFTPNKDYSFNYLDVDIDILSGETWHGWIYWLRLTRQLNLFNAYSLRDRRHLCDYNSKFFDIIEDLKTMDWFQVAQLRDFTRDELLEAVKGLGFDGVFNYEMKRNQNPSIGIFSVDPVQLLRRETQTDDVMYIERLENNKWVEEQT